ncbi:MAG: CARDB domain-containing protein [Candidatus Hodarchaeales archaeon]|jgi:subtilase family serine protease
MNYKWISIPIIFLVMIGMGLAYSNYNSISPLESGPDLAFKQTPILVFPENPMIGEEVNISVWIINKGDQNASGFWISFDFYNMTDHLDQNLTFVPYLDSNQSTSKIVYYTFNKSGIHTIKVELDVYDNISESNETNNIAYKNVTVYDPAILPDLTFVQPKISIDPINPVEGEPVNITSHIINNGTDNATDFLVEFRIDGKSIGNKSVNIISPNETQNITLYDYIFNKSGSYQIYVLLDSNHSVVESKEDNNYAYKNIVVQEAGGPDLTFYPPEISFDPIDPEVNESVEVTAYIINIGDADAIGISIYAGVIQPDGSSYGILNYWNESEILGPGENMTKTFPFTPNMSGIHTVVVAVNTTNVTDINQSNNVARKNITVLEAGEPDLTFYPPEISFDPINPEVNESVDITAYIINQGDANSSDYYISFYDVTTGESISWTLEPLLAAGENTTKTVSHTFDVEGIHTIEVSLNSSGESNYSNNIVYKNITVKSAPLECSGNIDLSFTPNPARKGQLVSATVSGLSNCDGKTVYVKGYNLNRTCIVSGSGCSFMFTAPTKRAGSFLYRAMIDKNDDGDFRDSGELDLEILNVIGWNWGLYKNFNKSSIGSTTSTLPSLPGY